MQRLIELAERMEFENLVALVLATNVKMMALLENTGIDWRRDADPELPATVVRLVAQLGSAQIRDNAQVS